MSLPTLNTPTYTTKLPSSGKKVKYRPFLVREEKLLLMAMESKDDKEIKEAVERIIINCTFEKCNPTTMALVDIEWLFLQLRIKSKGETANYSFKCNECATGNDKQANLNDVKIVNRDFSNVIKLTSDIGLQMKAPSYELTNIISSKMNSEDIFNIILSSIEVIYEGEVVYKASDFSKEELLEFIEDLNDEQFKKIQNYFEHLISLELDIDFTCAKCKKENTLTLKGLKDFLV